jgi:mono/diheme cytochrome c family protein
MFGRILTIAGIAMLVSTSGCRVSQPGRMEASAITWTKHNITVQGRDVCNPIPATADKIESGKQAFGFYCVVCHGRDGQNTGVPFADKLSPPIPSLTSPQVQSYTDGQLKWVIENGVAPSGMPASKGILSDDDMWAIVHFLRHLPPAGSLGEPRTYTGDEYENARSGR